MNAEDVGESNVASVQAAELGQENTEKDFNAKIVSWYLTPRQWSQQGSLDKEVIMLRFIRSHQLWCERWITSDWNVDKESGEQGSFITPQGKITWELSIGAINNDFSPSPFCLLGFEWVWWFFKFVLLFCYFNFNICLKSTMWKKVQLLILIMHGRNPIHCFVSIHALHQSDIPGQCSLWLKWVKMGLSWVKIYLMQYCSRKYAWAGWPQNLVFPLLHLSHHQQYPWVSDLGLRIKFKNHLGIFLLALVGLRLRFH